MAHRRKGFLEGQRADPHGSNSDWVFHGVKGLMIDWVSVSHPSLRTHSVDFVQTSHPTTINVWMGNSALTLLMIDVFRPQDANQS